MTAPLLSRRDLDFILYELLDTEALLARPRYADHSRETFTAMLDTAEQIAVKFFQPHWKAVDEAEPSFDGERVRLHPDVKPAVDAISQAGFLAAGHDYDLGGMQLPDVVERAAICYFTAGNIGTTAYPYLAAAAANLIVAHGSPEQVDRFARPMFSGRFHGTMALSETQAGSSLSDITTRAVPSPDGTYRLFGSKMWISAGEHELGENIVHLVLARIDGAPPGVKGISLFIVPKKLVQADGSTGERNDVVLAGLNHKMGYRGSVNTVLNLGEGKFRPGGEPGAVGYLVGKPHHGLAYMFYMMNEARIGVGVGAVVLGYRGYLESLAYARTRPQGRRPGGKDPNAPQIPIIEHADVRRMLLTQKAFVEGGLGLVFYCGRLVDEARTGTEESKRDATRLLDLLTPIAKAWPSQFCREANDHAIQVLGGYGYSREYPVEQLYRDNRLNSIHEGTDGIQALDLLGRKVRQEDGACFRLLLNRIARTAAAAKLTGDAECIRLAAALDQASAELVTTTLALGGAPDLDRGLANAFPYLVVFGHTVVAWLWLEQAIAAAKGLAAGADAGVDEAFYRGKIHTARFFFDWELAKVASQHALLRRLDDACLTMRNEWF